MHSILESIKMAAEDRPYTPSVGKEIRIEIPKSSKKEENQKMIKMKFCEYSSHFANPFDACNECGNIDCKQNKDDNLEFVSIYKKENQNES